MNCYLLLGEPVAGSSNPAYRGTYRPGPTYIDGLPVASPINQLWMQETAMMIGDCFGMEEARRIQTVYAEAGFYFDIVIVMEKDCVPPDDNNLQFMGYDISHPSGYSLLSWGLNFDKPAPEFFHQRENPIHQPLLLLLQKYFRPLLNNYRLLPVAEEADFFLSVASAMTEGFGAVWESKEYGAFSVVKMYMVRNRETLRVTIASDLAVEGKPSSV